MPAASVVQPLNYHRKQAAYYLSDARFNIVPAGRRSGKTAIAKRRLRKKALMHQGDWGWRYIAAAPTHAQAKRIYWNDFLRLFPEEIRHETSKSELTITLLNGAVIQVLGMDEPARVEGSPVGHLLCDEYGNMKPEAWSENLRPTLTDTQGSADFIGAPEGRNHYYDMWLDALDMKGSSDGEWSAHTWTTEEVLALYLGEEIAAKEIKSAKASMDRMTYAQEYLAEFISFSGLAYYEWDRMKHARERLYYDPTQPLAVCFDFNREPGIAIYAQEQQYEGSNALVSNRFTAVVGEAYISKGSNTPAVCRQIIKDWRDKLKGDMLIYGDSTGGIKTTQSTQGSDWDLVIAELRPVFGDRLRMRVEPNPRERVRVNSMNSRLRSADGRIHMLVDPMRAPHLVRDFEGTLVKDDGSGEIDKDKDGRRWSHMTDALGYYIHTKYPVGDGGETMLQRVA
jgi:hypothetical protein